MRSRRNRNPQRLTRKRLRHEVLESRRLLAVLFTESFETDGNGTRYNAPTVFHNDFDDYWTRVVAGAGTSSTPQIGIEDPAGDDENRYTGQDGSAFWAAEDVDDTGAFG